MKKLKKNWSSVSRKVRKNVKWSSLGVFGHPFFCKIEKKRGHIGGIKKICEKKAHKAKKNHKKFWSRAGLEPMSFCLADLKKAVTSMPSASRSSVAQFSVSASQLIKSVSLLVFETVYEKRRLKT